jgi:hypothetical protein
VKQHFEDTFEWSKRLFRIHQGIRYECVKKRTGKAPEFCAKVRAVQVPINTDQGLHYNYRIQHPENIPKQQFHLNMDGTQSDTQVEGIHENRRLFHHPDEHE